MPFLVDCIPLKESGRKEQTDYNSDLSVIKAYFFYSQFPVYFKLWLNKVKQKKSLNCITASCLGGFQGGASGKEPACQCKRLKRCGFDPWFRKIPWRWAWQPTIVFLPGESHGDRHLVGYSPQNCRAGHDWSDLAHMHTSCLEACVWSQSAWP